MYFFWLKVGGPLNGGGGGGVSLTVYLSFESYLMSRTSSSSLPFVFAFISV